MLGTEWKLHRTSTIDKGRKGDGNKARNLGNKTTVFVNKYLKTTEKEVLRSWKYYP